MNNDEYNHAIDAVLTKHIRRLEYIAGLLFALLTIMAIWNIALRSNVDILQSKIDTLETCLNSTLIAYEDLNNSIVSGTCLPKIKGF